jgi:hypothetical protein
MGRWLRERKPRAVKEVAARKVQVREDSDKGDDDEDSLESEDDESEDESEETEEKEQEEVPQTRGTGGGRGRKRKQGRADRRNPPKKRRRGTVAKERAAQTHAPEALQVALLKSQVAELQLQIGHEQQQPKGSPRSLPDLQPLATHNNQAAAILLFTAQNMRAAAVEQLAATIANTPRSKEVDSFLASLPTTGRPQNPDEVD